MGAFADLPELDSSDLSPAALECVLMSTPGKVGFVGRRLLHSCGLSASVEGTIPTPAPCGDPTDSSVIVPSPEPCGEPTDSVEDTIPTPAPCGEPTDSSLIVPSPEPCAEPTDTSDSSPSSVKLEGSDEPVHRSLLIQPDEEVDPSSLVTSDYLRAYGQKAAKDDDAAVPVELWNSFLFRFGLTHLRFEPEVHGRALEVLRTKFALPRYRRLVTRSFCRHLRLTYGSLKARRNMRRDLVAQSAHPNVVYKGGGDSAYAAKLQEFAKDLAVGMEGIRRILYGSWWEWDNGSTLFFWRWPKLIRQQVRDGVKVFVEKPLPSYRKRQQVTRDPEKLRQVGQKIDKVIQRKYLHQTYIKSLINFFDVPKGESDIRLVYDGTKSGLNDAVWAPNFFLCSVDSALMWTNADTWYSDRDLGEMFLNYFLDEALRSYSGVDVTQVKAGAKAFWLAWGRTFMGFKPSPYIAAKLFGWTIDIIYGNREDPENPFKWDSVLVNLPGQADYDPTQPRICKLDGHLLACLLEAYVDDIRGLGSSEERCQRASSRIAQITQYLGQQDAARKCRPPHKVPGPWCGAFMASKDDCVWVYVSQAKWEKAKAFVLDLCRKVELTDSGEFNAHARIDFKFLEKGRGFLVYFSRTYPSIVPYLKGIHLTLDSWRPHRNSEGWKVKPSHDELLENLTDQVDHEDLVLDSVGTKGNPKVAHPSEVSPVPRLGFDLLALRTFLDPAKPPWRFVRGGRACIAQYGFADAAKSGFGATFESKEGTTWYRLGVWSEEERNESSNYRELNNLVETLEDKAKDDSLTGLEIFLFTDNSTAELAFYKGTSSSEKLFNLVLRLRQLEMHEGCIINFIHVSGSRMISQGTDGLSRGDAQEGVMKGASMSSFIPLHLSCLDRQPKLKSWLQNIITPSHNQMNIEFLNYSDWFERGHDIKGGQKNEDGIWIPNYLPGTFIWTPPPAAGQIAIEQLRRARVKREYSTHVVVIPRLMAPEWQRQLFRVADLYIELPFIEMWNKETHHEPLREIWKPCRKVWCGKCYKAQGPFEFHIHEATVEVDMCWRAKDEQSRFKVGVDGAFLVVPFQCDLCWFRNLKHQDFDPVSFSDRRLMCYIRRANLDLIWSRSPSTIASVRRNFANLLQSWKDISVVPSLPSLGPWPVKDTDGFSLALGLLRFSQNEGRNERTHLQFDSVRKLRTTLSHIHEASVHGSHDSIVSFRTPKGDTFQASTCATQSRFYTFFMRGLLLRMGRQTKVDFGLDIRILLEIQSILKSKIQGKSVRSVRDDINIGSFLVLGFVCALRGYEVFMLEAGALKNHVHHGKEPQGQTPSHVVIPLLGRFKGEDNDRLHLMVSVSVTPSGLDPRFWVEKLVELNSEERNLRGPAFVNSKSELLSSAFMNEKFHDLLEDVQVSHPILFPDKVEIRDNYSVFRSLRRGSTARVVDMQLPESEINLHNRWRSVETKRGQRSSKTMCDYYTDLRLVLRSRLRYTQSL